MTVASRAGFIAILETEYGRRVNKSTLSRWVKGGRVIEIDGKVEVEKSIDLLKLTRSGREDVARRHREEADDKRNGAAAGDDDKKPLSAIREERAEAETRSAIAKADRDEMERDRLAGTLVSWDEVSFAFDDVGAALRTMMDNFADRITPIVHPLQTYEEKHAANTEFAQEVLQTMHDRMLQLAHERKPA